jgi:hypothetical protein
MTTTIVMGIDPFQHHPRSSCCVSPSRPSCVGFAIVSRASPKCGIGLTGQLYNLADDQGEVYNLYGERPDIVARLTKLIETYEKQGHTRY